MLLIQNLSNALKIATRKRIIERNGGRSSRRTKRKRRIAKSRRDGEGGVIGKCSDSSIVQEALCTNTKDD